MKLKALDDIPIEYVAAFHGKESAGKDAETWVVSLVGQTKRVYLKLTQNNLLTLTELAAAQTGRALGLNIPKAYLVEVTNGDIPPHIDFNIADTLYCFASESCGDQSVSFERLRRNKSSVIESWKEKEETIIFDEWIANTDRHNGNLVYEPKTKTYWLIDHGRALCGSPNSLMDLSNPKVSVTNQLLNDQAYSKDEAYKNMLHIKSKALMLKCQTIDLSKIDHNDHFSRLEAGLSRAQVITFLSQRISETTELLCNKIGLPMLFPVD